MQAVPVLDLGEDHQAFERYCSTKTPCFWKSIQCLPSILHRADGKQTGSENRFHVSGPRYKIDMREILERGSSQVKRDGTVPEYRTICRCPGNLVRGRDAEAQQLQHSIIWSGPSRAYCIRIRLYVPRRSEEALDEEVRMVHEVTKRGSIRTGCSCTYVPRQNRDHPRSDV